MASHHVVLVSLTIGSHKALATLCWMLTMFHVYAEHGIRAVSKPHSEPWEGLCSGPQFRIEKTETHRVSCITPPKAAVGKWKSQNLNAELTDSKLRSSFIMLFWMVWSVERVCWGCMTGHRECVGKSRGEEGPWAGSIWPWGPGRNVVLLKCEKSFRKMLWAPLVSKQCKS